jgi:cyclic pyranopterin phosphate synthase
MPHDEYTWIERSEVLSFEEIERIARISMGLGVEKIRLTGGEPLMRRGLERLVERLARLPGLQDLTLTTNGALLEAQAPALASAGLVRINVSLDTLNPDRFQEITRRGRLSDVLAGIAAAIRAGMGPIKVNAVVIRGFNDDELIDMARYGRDHGAEIRFIEYMDVGNANAWKLEKTVPKSEILSRIHAVFPLKEVGRSQGSAPAVDYAYEDGAGQVGIIGSVTEPFCSSCVRARLTADGRFITCLFAESGFDLKALLRGGHSDSELARAITEVWSGRTDRYSDLRWQQIQAGAYKPDLHRKIEMITLGG